MLNALDADRAKLLFARMAAVMAMGIVAGALAACGFSEGRDKAALVADQYFSAVQAGDITGALSLYSDRFYGVTARDKWTDFLNDVRRRCGVPKSHSLATWNVANLFGMNSGIRATLVYSVLYSSCKMTETMTIFIPDGEAGKIEGHFFNREPVTAGGSETTTTT
jgi:hypothetical protein